MAMPDQSETLTLVRTTDQLGAVVREARRSSGADQATTAGLAGVGVRFLGELERGKPTLRLGLVLRVLERLGFEVWIAPRGWRPEGR
jgi:y4mF family transcriptional regulator